MIKMTNKCTLLAGLLIIIISNAVALGGVVYNRSGDPTSSLTLSERELALPYYYGFEKENSGISLKLRFRVYDEKHTNAYYGSWNTAKWLDGDKLAELGFDVSYPLDAPDSDNYYHKLFSREVFLVLENDGKMHEKVMRQCINKMAEANTLLQENPDKEEFEDRLKKTKDELEAEQFNNSRLFAIDAGLDYEALREKYSDRSLYLIARGRVMLRYYDLRDEDPYLAGIVKQLSITDVNIPLEHASVLIPLLDESNRDRRKTLSRHRSNKQPARYEVELHYGQRYEPWVTGVKGLQAGE